MADGTRSFFRLNDMPEAILRVDGLVERARTFTLDDLAAVDAVYQVPDVSRLDANRRGRAVRLEGVLRAAGAGPSARHITLHSLRDDFHASVPLEAVRERALLIYALDDGPLPVASGGPVRFFIPDFAACHSAAVDECANVKFVDRIELSAEPGFDNRPADEGTHAELHRRQAGGE